MERKRTFYILPIAIGILLVILAPYMPDAVFSLINAYIDRFSDIRLIEIIPSIRLAGVMIFVYGSILLIKGDKKK